MIDEPTVTATGPDEEPAEDPTSDAPVVDSLHIERGGVARVTAGTVDVHMGGIGALDADEVSVQWGGVGAARAEKISVEFGSVGMALAGEMRVSQGIAGSSLARETTVEQSFVRTLIARDVTISRPSAVLVMIAGRVNGDVRPVLDWRGALVAGLAFGAVSALAAGARSHARHGRRRGR
jgi:hypothetical protein